VIGRHENRRERITLHVAGRALRGRAGEDSVQVTLLAAQIEVLSVEGKAGRLVVELGTLRAPGKGELRRRAEQQR